MTRFAAGLFIVAVCLSAAGRARADSHAVVESTRLYMDQETKMSFEYWIAGDRSSRSAAGRTTITRDDLGLVWNLDLGAKSYTETVIPKPPAPPSRQRLDMRKLWLDFYEPDFAWTIRETGASRPFNGFDCREFRASGEADFAEMSAVYWICLAPEVPGGQGVSRLLADAVPGVPAGWRPPEAPGGELRRFLRLPGGDGREFDRPDSPGDHEAEELEETEAPPGTYEIPAGFRKLDGRGER